MMKIKAMFCTPGRTGFYFDDQRAIKAGAKADGACYTGTPVTPGFTAVRQAGEAVCIQLLLENGQVAYGDCAAVQYSGAGGRDPLFLAEQFIPVLEKEVAPLLVGRELTQFRPLAAELDSLHTADGKPLHTALRYGLSQVALDAVARSQGKMMCQVLCEEYGLEPDYTPVPIFTQSGDNRYENADKMILKGAPVLPHALINRVSDKLGNHGEKLLEYVRWLRGRILTHAPSPDYRPVIHLDVYGTIGAAFNMDYGEMADYLAALAAAAAPLHVRVEGPMDVEARTPQMEALAKLTQLVDSRGINVELVADEWCNTLEDVKYFADNHAGHMIQIKTPDLGSIHNTVEAVLYCKQRGIGAYQGGTCNETERSAQICVHSAMATHPVQILAKPGMGVDEAYMIAYNEMQRIIALGTYLEKGAK